MMKAFDELFLFSGLKPNKSKFEVAGIGGENGERGENSTLK